MCGITGCIADINTETLQKMTDVISHRGPDFKSVESIGNVHLGHTRLSIVDLNNASNQPLWDKHQTACIVFNGEIYNFLELKEDLMHKGYEFQSSGDTEVLLNMYIEYGVSMFTKINGIFALAIWDTRTNELVIAKDHFGVKPLYYAHNEEGFFFSSEIKSILYSKKVKKEVCLSSLYRSLIFMWSPGEETIFEGIKKVLPAHYLIVKENMVIQNKCYWKWPNYNPSDKSVSEIKEQLSKTLQDSVKNQMISDVPVGTFLSGGLDSSLITAMADKATNKKIESFTIDTDSDKTDGDGFVNDLPYAKEAADSLSIPLNIVKAKPDIIKSLPKMVYHLEELQSDPAGINVMMISELARKKGIKVLLSGTGGDDVFTGYRRHFAVGIEKYWDFLPVFFRRIIKKISSKFINFGVLGRRVAKAFYYADLNEDERLLGYFYWMDPALVKDLFVKEAADKININIMSPLKNSLNDISTKNKTERMLHIERMHFLADHNLAYTDKMSMAHGVEVRVPFLDVELAEVASRINSKFKQKHKEGKWILKKVAEKYLPKNIIYRSKTGFGAPLRTWLNNDLKECIDYYLSEEKLLERGLFNPESVSQLILDDRKGKGDFSYTIFALLYLEIWFETFIDNEDPQQVEIKITK